MPAILIAKETHTRGNLHLQRESYWNGDPNSSEEIEGKKPQGPLIHGHFRNALPKELREASTFNEEAKKKPTETIEKIEGAMNMTYNAKLWINNYFVCHRWSCAPCRYYRPYSFYSLLLLHLFN